MQNTCLRHGNQPTPLLDQQRRGRAATATMMSSAHAAPENAAEASTTEPGTPLPDDEEAPMSPASSAGGEPLSPRVDNHLLCSDPTHGLRATRQYWTCRKCVVQHVKRMEFALKEKLPDATERHAKITHSLNQYFCVPCIREALENGFETQPPEMSPKLPVWRSCPKHAALLLKARCEHNVRVRDCQECFTQGDVRAWRMGCAFCVGHQRHLPGCPVPRFLPPRVPHTVVRSATPAKRARHTNESAIATFEERAAKLRRVAAARDAAKQASEEYSRVQNRNAAVFSSILQPPPMEPLTVLAEAALTVGDAPPSQKPQPVVSPADAPRAPNSNKPCIDDLDAALQTSLAQTQQPALPRAAPRLDMKQRVLLRNSENPGTTSLFLAESAAFRRMRMVSRVEAARVPPVGELRVDAVAAQLLPRGGDPTTTDSVTLQYSQIRPGEQPLQSMPPEDTHLAWTGANFAVLRAIGISRQDLFRVLSLEVNRSIGEIVSSLGFTQTEVERAQDLSAAVTVAALSGQMADIAHAVHMSDGLFTSPKMQGVQAKTVAVDLERDMQHSTMATGVPSPEALKGTPPSAVHLVPEPLYARMITRPPPGPLVSVPTRLTATIETTLDTAKQAMVRSLRTLQTIRLQMREPAATGPQLAGMAFQTSRSLAVAAMQLNRLSMLFQDQQNDLVVMGYVARARATRMVHSARDAVANFLTVHRAIHPETETSVQLSSDPQVRDLLDYAMRFQNLGALHGIPPVQQRSAP